MRVRGKLRGVRGGGKFRSRGGGSVVWTLSETPNPSEKGALVVEPRAVLRRKKRRGVSVWFSPHCGASKVACRSTTVRPA